MSKVTGFLLYTKGIALKDLIINLFSEGKLVKSCVDMHFLSWKNKYICYCVYGLRRWF